MSNIRCIGAQWAFAQQGLPKVVASASESCKEDEAAPHFRKPSPSDEVVHLERQLFTSLLGQRRGPALSVKACVVTG